MKLKSMSFVLTSALITIAATSSLAQTSPSYEVVDHFKVGGDGGWDYLTMDSKNHHLFVTRGNAVQVVDTATGKLADTISNLEGSHGVALANELKLGFISNGRGNSVTVFDLDTLKIIDTVKITGTNPDAILYEPTQKQVYTINKGSNNITVLDAATRKIVNTIPALEGLEFAVTNGKGKVFINSEDSSEIAVINVQAAQMEAHWKLGSCKSPTGLAIDVAHDRLFSVCANNKMAIVDASSGKLIADLPIGSRPDAAAFDAGLNMAYSSNGDGSLTVIHEDDANHFRLVENLPTQNGARTMTLDPETHRLFFSTAQYGPVPTPTAETPRPRPPLIAGSFAVLVVAPKTMH